jgi:hypothetical protein
LHKLFGARSTPAGPQAKGVDASNVLAVEQLKRRPVASLGPPDRLRQRQGVVRLCAQVASTLGYTVDLKRMNSLPYVYKIPVKVEGFE